MPLSRAAHAHEDRGDGAAARSRCSVDVAVWRIRTAAHVAGDANAVLLAELDTDAEKEAGRAVVQAEAVT